MRPCVLAVLVLLLTACPAGAAPPSSEPLTLGGPSRGVFAPGIAFTAAGDAFLSWSTRRHARFGVWPGQAPPRVTHSADCALLDGPVRAGNRIVALEATRGELRVATYDRAGARRRTHVAARLRTGAATTAFAASARGRLAVIWIDNRFRLHAVEGDVVRGFGPPRRFGSLGPPDDFETLGVAAAFAEDGELVIVYSRRRGYLQVVETLVRGRRVRLGRASQVTHLRVASGGGRVVAVWGTHDAGIEVNEPYVVRAAIRERGRRRFGRARVVHRSGGEWWPTGHVEVAVARDGTAAAAWSPAGRRGFPVLATVAPPGSGFPRPARLDRHGAVGDVAVSPEGDVLVVWSRILTDNPQEPDQVFAALRPAGAAAFGPPEEVSPNEVATEPSAAFDGDRRPAVVWAARPGGPRADSGGGRNAVLRMARRE